MSLAPRRALGFTFCLVVASLAWAPRAEAQPASTSPSRRVVVLVVLPSAARLDASRLRVAIGTELGADVVTGDDPLAPTAVGTLTVGLEASGGAGTVTLRYDGRAEPVSRQMALPPAPEAAERAIVLLAGNLARDESAELALAVRDRRLPKAELEIDDTVFLRNGGRIRGVVLEEDPTVGVRLRLPDGTTRSLATSEVERVAYGGAPSEARPDAIRSTLRFGVGGEPALWYVPADSVTDLGGRIYGRMSLELSSLVTVRVDLGAGLLESVAKDAFGQGTTSIPVSVRADLQLNVARHYAMSLGVDLGVDIERVSRAPTVDALGPNRLNGGGTVTDAVGMLGFHASPLTLRFGRANQFQVAAQEGILFFLGQGPDPAFEQTVSFTYLFGQPAGH